MLIVRYCGRKSGQRFQMWASCVAALALTTGCGTPAATVSSADNSRPSVASESDAQTSIETANTLDRVLVGQWLGQAIINEDALEEKLTGMPGPEQDAAFVRAENFLSTMMAIHFRQDGTVESEVEIRPLGEQPIRDSSLGQWRVSKISDDQLIVETTELAADGTTSISQKTFQFYPDRNAFVMSVPVAAELQGCDAVMIFERQSESVNVAQQPAGTSRK